RASQLGLKVALVESSKLGGTCLHIGCIPTKALLESSELYHRVAVRGAEFGLKAEVVGYDYPRMAERRDAVVAQLFKGVQFLMKKNKIEAVTGKGKLRDRMTRRRRRWRGACSGSPEQDRDRDDCDHDHERGRKLRLA